MAKRNKRKVEEPKEITRKETRLRAKEREKNRRILLGAGAAIALVLLVLIIGALSEFVLKPNSAVATVDGTKITTQDFRKRVLFEQANLQNQLFQYQQFEAQFGGQDLFTSQISQIQSTLASPFALGLDVLDQMIEDDVLATKAVELGVTVSDEEVDTAIREEVAAIQGAVTVPQATSTAEAAVEATATAALFTPTPLPTVDASAPATVTVEAPPTPAPQPTRPLLTDASYTEGIAALEQNLQELSGMDLATYREITRSRLLRTKLQEQIGPGLVTATEEQVQASHILLRTQDPIPTPEASPTPVAEGEPTPEPTPAPRDDAATLALAQELRQRILDGEDFATLAQEYSEDPGSAVNGGDLGWFSRGMMVAPFEEAAFSLPVGEVSEPIQTDFGYHLILVTERDDARPKDEGQIQQEEQQAFSNWVSEQMLGADIERTDDLASALPTGM